MFFLFVKHIWKMFFLMNKTIMDFFCWNSRCLKWQVSHQNSFCVHLQTPIVACDSSCAMASAVILALVPEPFGCKGRGFGLPWTKVAGEFEDDFFWPSIKVPRCFFPNSRTNSSRTFCGFFFGVKLVNFAVLYPRQSMVNHFRLDRPREV